MDDKAALEDIRNGGHKGYLALCERYERRLRDYAGYLPETVAEKVVKKVLSQLEQGGYSFNQETELSTWLYRMTDYAIDELALERIRLSDEPKCPFTIKQKTREQKEKKLRTRMPDNLLLYVPEKNIELLSRKNLKRWYKLHKRENL